MPAWLAPAVAGTMIGAGMFGKKGSGGSEALDRAIAEFSRLRAPTAEEMQVQLQDLVLQGVITPEQAQTYLIDNSAWNDVSTDPVAKAAQYQALNELQGISKEGYTPIEKAASQRIQDELETSSRGDQLAIMESMRRRGAGGSGMELAARLMANQGATSRASRAGLETAAAARERALQALMQSGQLAGQIRGQGYDEAARKAAALDEIQKFNTGNRQSVENMNVGLRTDANKYNLGERQRISDYNTAQGNENTVRNADLKQKQFENEMSIAAGKSGQYAAKGALEEERRKGDQAYNAALIGAGGSILSGYK